LKSYFLILTIVLTGSLLKAQNVYIPDSNFKSALVNDFAINTNGDTEIQVSEAAVYTGGIYVSLHGISDLTGIAAFTALTYIDCHDNSLTNLNVSGCTALTHLDFQNNAITNIDVSICTALTYLDCSDNQLTSLNVMSNADLTLLDCSFNQLTSLNVSANTALTDLLFENNSISSLNVLGNTALINLSFNYNTLTSLNISANTALVFLSCRGNQLTSLDVSTNTALTQLWCDYNQLTSLDVSTNTALTKLTIQNNLLTSLDVAANLAITFLGCGFNQLTSLNISANAALTNLWCDHNQLTSLDVSSNAVLTFLICGYNQLTSLNIQNGNNLALTNFYAMGNPNLNCIQVDSVDYANNSGNWQEDVTTTYSTNCNYPPTNCYAHFTMSPDTVPQTWYALNQCTGNGTINYVWNWGDGTPNDSTANPSHTYTNAGYYNICVSITDSSGCTNSYCDSSVYINKSLSNAVINISVVNQLPTYIITAMESLSKAKFTIYPNPTSTTLNIQAAKSNNSHVKIYDAIGQLYVIEILTNQHTSLNIEHLQSGIYFIKVDDTVQKFVKE
jgi:hypothetical protein